MYHVTEDRYLDKILNVDGLVPKSKNFSKGHLERVYSTKNIEDAEICVLKHH